MGLLEKAQQRKQGVGNAKELVETTIKKEEPKVRGLLEKAQRRKQAISKTKTVKEKTVSEEVKTSGLLEKALQRKQLTEEKKTTYSKEKPLKEIYTGLRFEKEGKPDIIDERKGFGWKGLGSRTIVFDQNFNEYRYEVSEPVLNDLELEIKNELTLLFKMLADVNVYGLDKEEKKKYLEETLEQIIVDNDISFDLSKMEETDKKKILGFLGFIRKKETKKGEKLKLKEGKEEKPEDDKKVKIKKKIFTKTKKIKKRRKKT